MACPTCLKLGVSPPSRFCAQDCFKCYWDTHKLLHKKYTLPREFKGYKFSGPLRAYEKSPKREVPDWIARPDYADHPDGESADEKNDKSFPQIIPQYSEEEILGIRDACRIGREVLDIAGKAVRVGITCDELDEIVHEETIKRGGYPSPLNYYKFPKSVCTSVNEVICHGIPDYYELKDGDIINLDISVFKDGYHGDLNETFLVGNVDEASYNLVKCAYDCLTAAVNRVKPGVMYRDLGEEIAIVANKAKCSIVTTYCGHGIGKLFHTSPNVPHYAKNKAKGVMQVGHIFTIEPMINMGTYKDDRWPDEWTAVTSDGSRSAQFEHTMIVTETGCELLTVRTGEPLDRLVWTKEKFQR
jgi:methionyl aminopeptidase